MIWTTRSLVGLTLIGLLACSKINILDAGSPPGSEKVCTGSNCTSLGAFSWVESGFGICSRPCGMGEQTQDVFCLRHSDNIPVADELCLPPKPQASRKCNLQTCSATHAWNVGPLGPCSRTCGGGWRERQVVCQDQSGTVVAESFCVKRNKPSVSEFCNANPCPQKQSYSWSITPGLCSKPCGEGMATDKVECKKSDGSVVEDTFCTPARKPPSTHLCNVQPCEDKSSYQWKFGTWSACSNSCGPGLQTRSVVCQRDDEAFVPDSFCESAERPSAQQHCNLKTCPPGRKVVQSGTTDATMNSVDLLLIVDDSATMAADIAKLSSRLANILMDFETQKIDYQVCLTTTDVSYMQGSPLKWQGLDSHLLTTKSPNKGDAILKTLTALGEGWGADEQGIKAFHLFLRDHKSSGCVRENAVLAVLLLSDENERSVGGNKSWSSSQYRPLASENDPKQAIQLFESSFKAKRLLWNSIIVKPFDSNCQNKQDAQGAPSFYGSLYADLANRTGGVIGSICDADYGPSLREVNDRILNGLPGLTLECLPISAPTVTWDAPAEVAIELLGDQLKFRPVLAPGSRVSVVYTCPN